MYSETIHPVTAGRAKCKHTGSSDLWAPHPTTTRRMMISRHDEPRARNDERGTIKRRLCQQMSTVYGAFDSRLLYSPRTPNLLRNSLVGTTCGMSFIYCLAVAQPTPLCPPLRLGHPTCSKSQSATIPTYHSYSTMRRQVSSRAPPLFSVRHYRVSPPSCPLSNDSSPLFPPRAPCARLVAISCVYK